jgi:hypothetical protein
MPNTGMSLLNLKLISPHYSFSAAKSLNKKKIIKTKKKESRP